MLLYSTAVSRSRDPYEGRQDESMSTADHTHFRSHPRRSNGPTMVVSFRSPATDAP